MQGLCRCEDAADLCIRQQGIRLPLADLQHLYRPCTALCLCPTEPAPVPCVEFSDAFCRLFCKRLYPFAPLLQFVSGQTICGDVVEPWLYNVHLHLSDRVQQTVLLHGTEGVQPQLRVVLRRHCHTFPVFQVYDVQRVVVQDHTVPCTKSAGDNLGKVQPLFYDYIRRSGKRHAQAAYVVHIGVCVAVHFPLIQLVRLDLCQPLLVCRGLRDLKLLTQFQFCQTVGKRSLSGVAAGSVGKLFLQCSGRGAVYPPMCTGGG